MCPAAACEVLTKSSAAGAAALNLSRCGRKITQPAVIGPGALRLACHRAARRKVRPLRPARRKEHDAERLRIEVTVERIRIEQHTWTGTLWFFGWLFTIGYLHLTFWKGVLGVVLWPYYLGAMLSTIPLH